jgi:protein-tyrosine phosphatase
MDSKFTLNKPIPHSYWVIPGSFLAGCYPGSTHGEEDQTRRTLKVFLEAGFTSFFDLTQPDELPSYGNILLEEASQVPILADYQRFPIPDFGLPSQSHMMKLLAALDGSMAAGKKVYLHCRGGIGRTGTAVGCWLVQHGLPGTKAVDHLAELYRESAQSRSYPRSPETDEQRQFILDWKGNGLA